MILWTSSEESAGLGDGPMKMLLDIEDSFNEELSDNDYGGDVSKLRYIAIILGEGFDIYDEVKKFDPLNETEDDKIRRIHDSRTLTLSPSGLHVQLPGDCLSWIGTPPGKRQL